MRERLSIFLLHPSTYPQYTYIHTHTHTYIYIYADTHTVIYIYTSNTYTYLYTHTRIEREGGKSRGRGRDHADCAERERDCMIHTPICHTHGSPTTAHNTHTLTTLHDQREKNGDSEER